MKMPNMCPFEKNEKEVFFRLTFFFQEKKILSKEQLLFSFLCIVRQKKILKLLSKFSIFSKGHIFGILLLVS